MSDSTQTIRIFISSPGDVAEERDGAKRVIEGLQRLYPGVTLQPVLWEDLALPATASFQETIDFLLEREPIDVAVFILWSRLGSPLGAAVTKADGTEYRSGTEREFDLMLTAFEQSGRKRPQILAYLRDDDAGFKRKLSESPNSELQPLIDQQRLAEAFIVEQFQDAEGRNLRAYQTYREPVSFIQRLRIHLRQAIDELIGADAGASWTEEPYRGLQVFDIHHAPIFHGRDEEVCELLQRRRDQEQAGCAFVVIVGASGSGKSSLARAGVAASLIQNAGDDGVTRQWRTSALIPTLAEHGLCGALVRSIAESLPELGDSEDTLSDIAEGLAENAPLTVKLSLSPVLASACQQAGGKVKWLLILDQMEELWTDRNTTVEDRERFLAAIEALASCGHVSVLATLRSDFYHHAQNSDDFLRMKGERGHFDLRPPNSASVHRLITEPARLSGLKFERNEQTGRSLDEVILGDAATSTDALPLLEYTLSELYRQRDEERRMMTFAAYAELGGVEGAIGKRADETFASLPVEAQEALEEILPLLVSVDVAGEQSAVRRRASVADLTSTPARKTLTERLIEQRFLTTDREGETPVASLAHEALLRSWDRIVGWINANREQLRLRARVEQQQQRWQQQDHNDSLLLPEGLPLDEGRQLLGEAPYLLSEPTKDYIQASIDGSKRKARKSRRTRTIVLSTIAVLLVLMIVGGIYLRVNTLVEGLVKANTSEVPEIVEQLAGYPIFARSALETAWADSPDDSNAKLHAGLALVAENKSLLPTLRDRLLTVTSVQFQPVRDLLADDKDELVDDYWKIAKDSGQDSDRRFQAACALANYDPYGQHWRNEDFQSFVARHLVNVRPSDLLPWTEALRPVKNRLVVALSEIYGDPDAGEQVRSFATDTLAEYQSGNADALFDLLAEANEKQFAVLLGKLDKHRERSIELGNSEVAKTFARGDSEAKKETVAKRQANAAAMLLRMNAADQVWPLLKHSPDPRVRSYIIHWLSPRGVDAAPIIARYDQETDDTIKRALLLCLGEFALSDDEKQPWIEKLLGVYRTDPDAGLHAAAEWVLRQWKQGERIAKIDQELQQNEKQLAADQDTRRQWYVNTQSQTFAILDADEFQMGSPETEDGHNADERLHLRNIGRRIAIATKEVTHEQWRVFSQANSEMSWPSDQDQLKAYIRTDDSPMNGMKWYEAAWYCNWLSEREGIEPDQWCYEKNGENKYGPGMKAKDNFLELTGYRLPTEAEWEYACRAGVSTSRYYGVTETLLPRYAWYLANGEDHTHPVASLKPNDYGLFDMHGNVFEWCYDAYEDYPTNNQGLLGTLFGSTQAVSDFPSTERVEDAGRRVLRGGSFTDLSSVVRSAYRTNLLPDYRYLSLGLRPARTYHLSP